MIRVIIERQLKKGEDVGRLLLTLRMTAMMQKGYISSETLISTENRSVTAVISNWQSIEDWKAWYTSKERQKVNRQIDKLLVKKPVIKTYEIISPEEREFLEDPHAWMQKKERPHFAG